MIYALPEKYLNNNYKMHFRAICMQKFAFFGTRPVYCSNINSYYIYYSVEHLTRNLKWKIRIKVFHFFDEDGSDDEEFFFGIRGVWIRSNRTSGMFDRFLSLYET